MLRYVLLGLMAENGPMHGYALMKAFSGRSGVRVSIGNVYRELQRLRTEGLIVAVQNPAGDDPRRVPHTITDSGRRVLKAWLTAPAAAFLRDPVDPLYYRLALLGEREDADVASLLDDLQEELRVQNRRVERQRLEAGGGRPILSILLGRRTRHIAADIELLEELRKWQTALPSRAMPKSTNNGKGRREAAPSRTRVRARVRAQ